MIVRNEAAIIRRCLDSVTSYIQWWCILDSGSSDGTCDIIRQWAAETGIPGELHHDNFIDFSTARNRALDRCRASPLPWDYVLMMDADLVLATANNNWPAHLSAESYGLAHVPRSGQVWWRTMLLSRRSTARYVGRTHETLDQRAEMPLFDVWLPDFSDGHSRAVKFDRDLELLVLDLTDDIRNPRSWHYLGLTLAMIGRPHDAIMAYDIRKHMLGDRAENHAAQLNCARCQLMVGDVAAFVDGMEATFARWPGMVEPIVSLSKYYASTGQVDLCANAIGRGMQVGQQMTGLIDGTNRLQAISRRIGVSFAAQICAANPTPIAALGPATVHSASRPGAQGRTA
jgi:hypothetical protein